MKAIILIVALAICGQALAAEFADLAHKRAEWLSVANQSDLMQYHVEGDALVRTFPLEFWRNQTDKNIAVLGRNAICESALKAGGLLRYKRMGFTSLVIRTNRNAVTCRFHLWEWKLNNSRASD